ncbi:MAG: HEPN domain-containing protein [Candidatus Bathyarchaeia archaeon]|nr:HEPN domain-containing protein [Candidatus Bathyarchaeota archaeon]
MPIANRKALDWISMAEEDAEDSRLDYRGGRYASSVYHAELCAQKSVKGVIVALGFEPGKTHRPSLVLRGLIIAGLINLREEVMHDLDRLIALSLVLEDQGVAPRYGWETVNRIIKPSEIYDEEKARLLIDNADETLKVAKKVLGELDC